MNPLNSMFFHHLVRMFAFQADVSFVQKLAPRIRTVVNKQNMIENKVCVYALH